MNIFQIYNQLILSVNSIKNSKKQLQNEQTPQEKDVSTKLLKRVDILETKLDKMMDTHLGGKWNSSLNQKLQRIEKQPKKK